MYAVVTTGGKQYRVAQGDVLRVEKIAAPVGDQIELNTVNLVVKPEGLVADAAALKSAKVVCTVMDQGRLKKIRVYKRKRRKNYARTIGHRQAFTALKVNEIVC